MHMNILNVEKNILLCFIDEESTIKAYKQMLFIIGNNPTLPEIIFFQV